jgi:hypothetical protein
MLGPLLTLLLGAVTVLANAPQGMTDQEVPRYLRGGELAEWSRARQVHDAGQSRIAQGTSIVNTPRVQGAGRGFETPAEGKARGERMIQEGREQVDRANVTLARLRLTAAQRLADMTKTVSDAADVPAFAWDEGLLLSVVRGLKSARDAGCTRHHLLGTWSFDAQGVPQANPALHETFREAWEKAQAERDFLQPAPAAGYRLAPPAAEGVPPSFAPGWTVPSRPGETALAWIEVHALDATASLVFLRVADAHSLRLLASEAFLSSPTGAKPATRGSLVLRDDRSFLPRLATQPSWRLGYAFGSPSLGAAVLRHVCHRLGHVTVWADDALAGLLPGSAGPSRANAVWEIRPAPVAGATPAKPGESAPAFTRAFRLASTAADQTVDVGELTVRLDAGPRSGG